MTSLLPQRPSLRSGLSCPDPSSISRPHPPHSQAHRNFTARRLIRDAFACAGAPRRPASGSGLSLLIPSWHAVLSDPGEFDIDPDIRCRHWPSPIDQRLGTPDTPAIRFTRAVDFVASLVRFRYSLPGCSPPVRIRLERPAFGDFYFQAFNGSVSLPVAGYNYNSDWTPLLAGTLFERLTHVTKRFDKRTQEFCENMSLKRNAELHSGCRG